MKSYRDFRTPLVGRVWSRINWKSEPVSARDRIEFATLLAAEGVPVAATRVGVSSARPSGLFRSLALAAGEHKRLQEISCNLPVSVEEQQHLDRYETAIQEFLKELLAPYNVVPVFQGDPRGATVKLRVPSGKTNDWGREGICVPWS